MHFRFFQAQALFLFFSIISNATDSYKNSCIPKLWPNFLPSAEHLTIINVISFTDYFVIFCPSHLECFEAEQ